MINQPIMAVVRQLMFAYNDVKVLVIVSQGARMMMCYRRFVDAQGPIDKAFVSTKMIKYTNKSEVQFCTVNGAIERMVGHQYDIIVLDWSLAGRLTDDERAELEEIADTRLTRHALPYARMLTGDICD